jgi:Uncharacterized membrane protein, possible Na+ channel or pump
MFAAIFNGGIIIAGALIGCFAGKHIPKRITESLHKALALCVGVIGIMGAVTTSDIIHAMICLIIGTIIGELMHIERGIDRLGNRLRERFDRHSDRENNLFAEGFLSASLLFCVGSMAILGSFDAGIRHDYSTIMAKSLIDGVTAVGLAATLGMGVTFSGVMVLVYQGLLTILAGFLSRYMDMIVITEMKAVGGILLMGMSLNMLFPKQHIRLGNMIPAIFFPIVYFPVIRMIGLS